MIRKFELYNRAISLRQKGLSYSEILESIPVAQSTISRWCSNVVLSEEQVNRLTDKIGKSSFIVYLKNKAIRSRKDAEIWSDIQFSKIEKAEKEILLLMSGILLYWAEGTKNKHTLAFTNTDAEMIKLMMKFFRKVLNVPDKKFRLMVRIGSKGNVNRAKKHWLDITGLSPVNLRNPEIIELTKKSKSLEKHPYGMCRIEVNNATLSRKLNILIQKFIENF